MFPNFTSLAQREQKRQELLERAQRRVRQAKAKRKMYEGASWTTDISNGISTVPKKSTESTQTDISVGPDEETPEELKKSLAEILKKSQSTENSQINPEVSTEPEVNVRPVMVDAEVDNSARTVDVGVDNGVRTRSITTNTNRANRTDRNVQARPETSDAGVDNSVRMLDAGTDSTPSMVDAQTNTTTKRATDSNNVDTEEQVLSREWIEDFFKENPNWASIGIHPIKKKNGNDDNRHVLREKGSMRSVKTGKKAKIMVLLIGWLLKAKLEIFGTKVKVNRLMKLMRCGMKKIERELLLV